MVYNQIGWAAYTICDQTLQQNVKQKEKCPRIFPCKMSWTLLVVYVNSAYKQIISCFLVTCVHVVNYYIASDFLSAYAHTFYEYTESFIFVTNKQEVYNHITSCLPVRQALSLCKSYSIIFSWGVLFSFVLICMYTKYAWLNKVTE